MWPRKAFPLDSHGGRPQPSEREDRRVRHVSAPLSVKQGLKVFSCCPFGRRCRTFCATVSKSGEIGKPGASRRLPPLGECAGSRDGGGSLAGLRASRPAPPVPLLTSETVSECPPAGAAPAPRPRPGPPCLAPSRSPLSHHCHRARSGCVCPCCPAHTAPRAAGPPAW